MRQSTLIIVLATCMCVLAVSAYRAPLRQERKQLQGSPSEFSSFTIPKPEAAAVMSSKAFTAVTFTKDPNSNLYSWKGSFPVDSTTVFSFGLFSPYEKELKVHVTSPELGTLCLSCLKDNKGSPVAFNEDESTLPPAAQQPVVRQEIFGFDGASYPMTTYTFNNPTPGVWSAELIMSSAPTKAEYQAAIVLWNESPVKMYAHINTYELELDQEVGLVANIFDDTQQLFMESGRPIPLKLSAADARMEVTFPDGREVEVTMHDDGNHADLLAADGIYGAVLQASKSGVYTAKSVFNGVTQDGVAFKRTTEHVFAVVLPEAALTGLSSVEYTPDEKALYFHVDVDILKETALRSEPLTVKAFAEVWGTDQTGLQYIPIAWVQSMADVETKGNRFVVSLYMNEDWAHKAGATAPFQLRNVWIEDRETNALLSFRAEVFVEGQTMLTSRHPFRLDHTRKNVPVTEVMRVGPRPAYLMRNSTSSTLSKKASDGTIILVHGYCATINEFPVSDFTNAIQFKDYKQSISNDEFALRIKAFAEKQNLPAFSLVAHSQGGLASTHLHAYYWSALENSEGGHKIQSVGSPYHGCGLAGGLANLGSWFGVGCGKNNDLSYSGAEPWLAAIPLDARQDLWYYTTKYGSDGYCVWGANMFLYKPNDGTTEISKAPVEGAHEAGTVTNWCHTTGMIYPAQCTDPARNKEMNQNAAR